MADGTGPRVGVLGALAYDQIGKTDTVFGPEGPGLNCKVTDQQEFFGGCAGNIAYGLNLSSTPALVISCVGGEDFRRYAQHLDLALDGVLLVQNAHCARANIITDPEGKQFTAFAPGPDIAPETWQVHLQNQPLETLDLFVCAPFPGNLMTMALAQAKQRNSDLLNIWLPGQYADGLDRNALGEAARYADVIIGNNHEIAHIRRTSPGCLGGKVVIETDGARPVRTLLPDGNQRTLPVPKAFALDPTGCGDAFVAGLIPELLRALDSAGTGHWSERINGIIRAGIRQASKCLEQRGSQTYQLATHP